MHRIRMFGVLEVLELLEAPLGMIKLGESEMSTHARSQSNYHLLVVYY